MSDTVVMPEWLNDVFMRYTNAEFAKMVEEKRDAMDQLNIVNIGKTGVGKSTLINAVFGETLAATGVGRPVTKHCAKYTYGSNPISIYDSKGIETGTGPESMSGFEDVLEVVERNNSSNNIKDYIHICWYCVLEESKRIEDNEIEIIKRLRQEVPVIVVITQSMGGDITNALVREIRSLLGDIDTIPIMALPKEHKSEYGETRIVSHGVDLLVNRSYELLPDSVQKTFAAYQKAVIELKVIQARKAGLAYAGAVAAASLQPLPIADAPIMVGIQIAMMANITALFGVDPKQLDIKSTVAGLGGPFAAAVAGRTLVSLLKTIPGVGTVAGGVINATTGAALTLGIANIYIGVLSSIMRNNGTFDNESILVEMNEAAKKLKLNDLIKQWKESKKSSSDEEIQSIIDEVKKDL